MKKNRKILISALILMSVTVFSNEAKAATLNGSISGLFGFINKNIIGQVKNDFCRQYILSLSNGEWREGEFRTNLGKKICVFKSVPSPTTGKIVPATVQPLNGNTSVSQVEALSNFSVNNPTPDVYVQNTATNGNYLNNNQIISLTNLERENNSSSLADLDYNGVLKKIAANRVKDMFTYQYFEHNSPTGDNASKEAIKNGYSYITIGENIALGNFDGSKGLVTAWMNSPGHRANILNKNYTEIGVYAEEGIYKGEKVWIATQIFGKPISGCKEPDSKLKDKINNYKSTAESILANIKKVDNELNTSEILDAQAYNSKVAERNTFAGLYNNLVSEIKTLVAEYNKGAGAFNLCIKTQ